MSIDVVKAVIASDLPQPERAVAVAIAVHMKQEAPDLPCYLLMKTLVNESGFCARAIQGALKRLRADGVLDIEQRLGRSSYYTLDVRALGNRERIVGPHRYRGKAKSKLTPAADAGVKSSVKQLPTPAADAGTPARDAGTPAFGALTPAPHAGTPAPGAVVTRVPTGLEQEFKKGLNKANSPFKKGEGQNLKPAAMLPHLAAKVVTGLTTITARTDMPRDLQVQAARQATRLQARPPDTPRDVQLLAVKKFLARQKAMADYDAGVRKPPLMTYRLLAGERRVFERVIHDGKP